MNVLGQTVQGDLWLQFSFQRASVFLAFSQLPSEGFLMHALLYLVLYDCKSSHGLLEQGSLLIQRSIIYKDTSMRGVYSPVLILSTICGNWPFQSDPLLWFI